MLYTFCPKCGGKLENRHIEDNKRLVCRDCNFVFYQNSKPTASALIIKNNKVLLVLRAIEPRKDCWDVPGGFLELGEHPDKGVIREIKEELNIDIRVKEMFGIFMDVYGPTKDHTLNIYYLAEIKKGKLKPSSDVKSFKWFDINNLPSNLAFKANKEALKASRKKLKIITHK